MLHFIFCEASQKLRSFRQIFFRSFKENTENLPKLYLGLLAFFLGNYEKISKSAQVLRGLTNFL